MGGAGDPPAPVGDPPTGTAAGNVAKRPCSLARTVAPFRSGESPAGTGGSPVLPANHFPNTLSGGLPTAKSLGSSSSHSTVILNFFIVLDVVRRISLRY